MGVGVLGVDLKALLKRRDGLVVFFQFRQRTGEAPVALHIFWVALDARLEVSNGLVHFLRVLLVFEQNHSQSVVAPWAFAVGLEALAKDDGGFGELFLRAENTAEVDA